MQIHELQLWTQNLDRQHDFYTRVLELPVIYIKEHQFAVAIGASTLVFNSTSQPFPSGYHFAINIPGQQFAAGKEWLARRVKLLTNPQGADELFFPDWDAHAVYFSDADGNVCELISRHRFSQPHSPEFNSASLLKVSEIGLVVDDVPAFSRFIEASAGISLYRGITNDLFMALGDEQGLLLIVKRGRLWLSDLRLAAVDAPLVVRFSQIPSNHFRIEGPPYRLIPENSIGPMV